MVSPPKATLVKEGEVVSAILIDFSSFRHKLEVEQNACPTCLVRSICQDRQFGSYPLTRHIPLSTSITEKKAVDLTETATNCTPKRRRGSAS